MQHIHALPPGQRTSTGDRRDDGTGGASESAGRSADFRPPFCPAAGCPYHLRAPRRRWFIRWGFAPNRLFGPQQRFRCRRCGACFSTMTFSVHYHAKRWVDLPALCRLLFNGAGVRALARCLQLSTTTVANRTERLARQALALHHRLLAVSPRPESLAADGFRSFCVSQYFPCDLTILVGCSTELLYGFDYAPLRRGGRMTDEQLRLNSALKHRVYVDPRATEHSFTRILDLTARLTVATLPTARTLWTDRHRAYRRAWDSHPHIRHLQARGVIDHRRVSSTAPRTAANPLWPVNYFDRELRKDLADHRRETVCFARNVCAMLNRLALYGMMHNLLKCRRIVGARSPGATETVARSHGAAAGWSLRPMTDTMRRLVVERMFLSREVLGQFAERLWRKEIPTPLKRRPETVRRYVLA